MIIVQEMCGRIGMVTGKGLAEVIKEHYSKPILYGAVFLLLVANTINIDADLQAMAASEHLTVLLHEDLALQFGSQVVFLYHICSRWAWLFPKMTLQCRR